jgi:hypothetical protein
MNCYSAVAVPVLQKGIWIEEWRHLLRRVALVKADVSEELSASFIRVTRLQGDFVFLRSVSRLLFPAKVVAISPILVTFMIESLSSRR